MHENPLNKLEKYGQSLWIDFIGKRMIDNGEIQRLIDGDGVSGVTSNPSIFEKAIAETHDYDGAIVELAEEGQTSDEIFETLAVADVQRVADLLRPVFDRSNGNDGFVSIEVSPLLANDSKATIADAKRIWSRVARPNVMIKVPGTEAGLPAIRELIHFGINVNITLLFGLPRYRQVIDAYLSGLEDRLNEGKDIGSIASVASFFLSRIDVLLDPVLQDKARLAGQDGRMSESLIGAIAISSAKLAYRIYKEYFSSERFRKLSDAGAKTQRLLWASTSTKNPEYSDVKYVEPLIGPDTINTLPVETLDAYRDHGKPSLTLTKDTEEAEKNLFRLQNLGIDIDRSALQLEEEGIKKFEKAYETLIGSVDRKRAEIVPKGA